MTKRQKSLIWVPIGIATIVIANLIIEIEPTSVVFRIIAMTLIFELGFNIRKHYKELATMEQAEQV